MSLEKQTFYILQYVQLFTFGQTRTVIFIEGIDVFKVCCGTTIRFGDGRTGVALIGGRVERFAIQLVWAASR